MTTPSATPYDPLLSPWNGPYGGVPPWNAIQPSNFVTAFDQAIELAMNEIQSIADNRELPTFENTLVALERTGQTLRRLTAVFGVHRANLNLDPMPEIQKAVMPRLMAYEDNITQNENLFARIQSICADDQIRKRSVADQRLADHWYKEFVRRGARLNDQDKERLREINQQLAIRFADFSQNILKEEEEQATWIEDSSQLDGIPDDLVAVLADTARARGKPGQWAVPNTRSAVEPVLTYAANRALRKSVWHTFYQRGSNANANNNIENIREILKLRATRATMLGYATHAHWQIEPSMAKTPERAMELMMSIWPKALARVKEEVADLQAIADQENASITMEPWDYRFYGEKVRQARFDLNLNDVKPYMQLDNLIDAMLWCSSELFGLTYEPVDDVPVFHADVRVWKVTRKGELVGVFYLDPYARQGKSSGAWMTDYRVQQNIDTPKIPLVSNNSNFMKPVDGAPSLVSWDDATTLFHEFGHALHGLLSQVRYPSQSGTSVTRDYVEFPSQIYEHWLSTPEVLNTFCTHYETGEPMPKPLATKIKMAATFHQGFSTTEFLASALMDMRLHLADAEDVDPLAFEKQTLEDLKMPREICMRHRTTHFAHIFADDGYSAGYYSYLWADALTADAAEAFEEAGGYFDRETARRLHDTVLSVGDTVDPAEGFRAFRGRDVDPNALLRKRGFPTSSDSQSM